MVFWEGSGRAGWHREKLETPHGFLGKFLLRRWTHQKKMKCQYGCWEGSRYQGQRTKKNLKRHMVFWQGSGCRNATWSSGKVFAAKVDAPIKLETPHRFLERFFLGRSTYKKKIRNATWFSGKVGGAKVDAQKKTWNATWFSGKVLGAETPHGLLGRFLGKRSTHQKNLKRHKVVWKGSFWEGRLTKRSLKRHMKVHTKKTWNATWFSGKVLVRRLTPPKKLKHQRGFWEGSGCRNATWFSMFSGRVCWEGRRTNMVLFFLNCISCRCRLLGGFGPRDGTSRTFLKNRTFQKFFVRRPSQQEPSQKYMCRFKFLLCPTSHPQPSQKTMWRFKLFWVSQPSQQQPKNANKHWSLPSWSSPTLSWLKSRLSNYFCPMRVKAEMYRQAVKAGQGGFEPLTSRHRHWIASDLEPLILDFGFRILDFGFRILDFEFWILNFGFWILNFGFWSVM